MTALKLKYPILLEEPPPMAAKSLAALGKPSMKFLSPPAMVAPDVTEGLITAPGLPTFPQVGPA